MKKHDELSAEERERLQLELKAAEKAVKDLSEQLTGKGLLEQAPKSLSESIRQKIAESQKRNS